MVQFTGNRWAKLRHAFQEEGGIPFLVLIGFITFGKEAMNADSNIDEIPPLFMAPEQFLHVALSLVSFSQMHFNEVCGWWVSLVSEQSLFLFLVRQMLPQSLDPDALIPEVQSALWYLRVSSAMSVWFARALFFCTLSLERCLSQLSVHICCMAQALRVEGSALHETLSAHPHHLHLQCQYILTSKSGWSK